MLTEDHKKYTKKLWCRDLDVSSMQEGKQALSNKSYKEKFDLLVQREEMYQSPTIHRSKNEHDIPLRIRTCGRYLTYLQDTIKAKPEDIEEFKIKCVKYAENTLYPENEFKEYHFAYEDNCNTPRIISLSDPRINPWRFIHLFERAELAKSIAKKINAESNKAGLILCYHNLADDRISPDQLKIDKDKLTEIANSVSELLNEQLNPKLFAQAKKLQDILQLRINSIEASHKQKQTEELACLIEKDDKNLKLFFDLVGSRYTISSGWADGCKTESLLLQRFQNTLTGIAMLKDQLSRQPFSADNNEKINSIKKEVASLASVVEKMQKDAIKYAQDVQSKLNIESLTIARIQNDLVSNLQSLNSYLWMQAEEEQLENANQDMELLNRNIKIINNALDSFIKNPNQKIPYLNQVEVIATIVSITTPQTHALRSITDVKIKIAAATQTRKHYATILAGFTAAAGVGYGIVYLNALPPFATDFFSSLWNNVPHMPSFNLSSLWNKILSLGTA